MEVGVLVSELFNVELHVIEVIFVDLRDMGELHFLLYYRRGSIFNFLEFSDKVMVLALLLSLKIDIFFFVVEEVFLESFKGVYIVEEGIESGLNLMNPVQK